MDAKELAAIREMSKERLDLQTVPALLDYIDALKADMVRIDERINAISTTPFSLRSVAQAHLDIQTIIAEHLGKAED